MESEKDGVVEIDSLERGLLLDRSGKTTHHINVDDDDDADDDEPVLYRASFEEAEDNLVKYQTAQWVLYSLVLILAWGIGLAMLLYVPVRRHILRMDIRSRKLYVTPNAIVYKVRKPIIFPCFGVLKKEKHVLMPSVADVVIEQGYLQSLFGVYSARIENVGVRRPPSDDVKIQGITDPLAFRKAVLMYLSHMRSEAFSRQVSALEDVPSTRIGHSSVASASPSASRRHDSSSNLGELVILQKLDEIDSSVKRVRTMIEEQHPQASEPTS